MLRSSLALILTLYFEYQSLKSIISVFQVPQKQRFCYPSPSQLLGKVQVKRKCQNFCSHQSITFHSVYYFVFFFPAFFWIEYFLFFIFSSFNLFYFRISIFFTSLLQYNCFTMVCQFLLYNKVNQLYIYIYPHISSLLGLPPTLPIPPLQVVTKH